MITNVNVHSVLKIILTNIFFVLQDLETKVAELQRREQELQRMQFGGMAML